ncbi:hypothetical protein LR48_Vigan04g060700 [Vigna angularis]|uniref:Uncharacterized protein n=1 Tax=Phaseolus angularis TaxID=3914 RepID=A0A0L9UD12_PHAAN|nr:hypothetical protein LR48_Vigan04g060700 [Vigna angularis]
MKNENVVGNMFLLKSPTYFSGFLPNRLDNQCPSCRSPPRWPAYPHQGRWREMVGPRATSPARLDEEKVVIHKTLMLYDFVDAANDGGSGDDIRVDDGEAEICLKECVHHDAVAELEDLQGEDGAGEEHQREREERKLDNVIGVGGVCVMLLGEERGKAAESGIKLPAAVAENGKIEMVLVVQRNEDYGLGENKGRMEMKIVRVELEELKKVTLEKEEKTSSVLEPDEGKDKDVEKNLIKISVEIVEKSPKYRNELVEVIQNASITKLVKASKRSIKVKDRRAIGKKKKSNLIERSKPGVG